MAKRYVFPVYLNGEGKTPEDAWEDAVISLMEDPDQLNEMPDTYSIMEDEYEG